MKTKTKKASLHLLLGNEKHLPDKKSNADKIFRCLVCEAEQLGSEMDYHPAPHCKECSSRLVEEVE